MSNRRHPAGFTLIEIAVVVLLIALAATLVGVNMSRLRTRATLAGATADLQALLHGARQAALASGHDMVVMLFPLRTGKGPRVVVVEDPLFDFMSGNATLDFDHYDPEIPAYPQGGSVEILDLPEQIQVGPSGGMGGTLAAPLDTVTVNVACSFCSTSASANYRGAIRFDARGAATFYEGNATRRPSGVGASFTLTNPALGTQRITFVILSSTGTVQVQRHE